MMLEPIIEVVCESEDLEVREHFDDADIVAAINERLERGDLWAWCYVKVTARREGSQFVGKSSGLGCCSYDDESDFRAGGGYFDDMQAEALRDLESQERYAYKMSNGEVWTREDTFALARLIYKRWNSDAQAATVAWRRLYQNSTSESDFAKLIKGDVS